MGPSAELAYRIGAAARRPSSWVQLLKFGLVGGSGYLVNLAVFAFLAGTLDLHYAIAAVGAFCVAVTNNFLLNRHWFTERGVKGNIVLSEVNHLWEGCRLNLFLS